MVRNFLGSCTPNIGPLRFQFVFSPISFQSHFNRNQSHFNRIPIISMFNPDPILFNHINLIQWCVVCGYFPKRERKRRMKEGRKESNLELIGSGIK